MSKFTGMTIEQALNSQPVLRTPELVELFGRTARTLNRWQDANVYENPMPKPFSECRGAGNNYDSGEILDWYNDWPIRKKETLDS
ncbi:hypothetical protein HX005_06705 [Acinetobacter sp. R933-2]|uniref:hypothetical protein n=1 Tax=Acinetobacter sp. R933-2 TaxID=2746728 RepID=UPI002576A941|nr:hypothetical protein [Acinetobacter sp. R933-2]MDM1247072.1 hypothetical protein [Acinetobacter sp. R933-2]